MLVEHAVLPPVHGLLADETAHLPLQVRVGDLVAEVAYGPDEEVFAIGDTAERAAITWLPMRSPLAAQCRGTSAIDSSNVIRRIRIFLSALQVCVTVHS